MLANEAKVPKRELAGDDAYLQFAEEVKRELSDAHFQELMTKWFVVNRHALGHGLLAGLSVRRMVTTNYDPCMELAIEAVRGRDEFRVLTRHLAGGDQPWLLKLHGDIDRPETLIPTKPDYDRYQDEGSALYGVVQGLMLTSAPPSP